MKSDIDPKLRIYAFEWNNHVKRFFLYDSHIDNKAYESAIKEIQIKAADASNWSDALEIVSDIFLKHSLYPTYH